MEKRSEPAYERVLRRFYDWWRYYNVRSYHEIELLRRHSLNVQWHQPGNFFVIYRQN